jgi:hypothetical protein
VPCAYKIYKDTQTCMGVLGEEALKQYKDDDQTNQNRVGYGDEITTFVDVLLFEFEGLKGNTHPWMTNL